MKNEDFNTEAKTLLIAITAGFFLAIMWIISLYL